VSYDQNDWGSGATVSITIKNNGTAAINGWKLAWSFSGNQKITNMWNATFTENGTSITATNQSYNSSIPAGGTVSFGFNLSYSGTNAKPTSFTLNGSACQVQ
jgi:cellulase/cellobiase CelA1